MEWRSIREAYRARSWARAPGAPRPTLAADGMLYREAVADAAAELGAPWRKEHREAAVAAICALASYVDGGRL